ENITALRRFAIGAIKAKSRDTVAATIQRLARNVRLVFDYLRITQLPPPSGVPPGADGLERIRRVTPAGPLGIRRRLPYIPVSEKTTDSVENDFQIPIAPFRDRFPGRVTAPAPAACASAAALRGRQDRQAPAGALEYAIIQTQIQRKRRRAQRVQARRSGSEP
ncbi:MAG: hypothetical protein KBE53_12255, partial [Chromatiaceae bacterium]|nr:hypothetical protein [Chromatiaceae bacterium]